MQEIGSIRRTVALERRLDLTKHESQLFLIVAAHDRCSLTIKTIENVRIMLIILIQLQLLQNLSQLTRLQRRDICNALLLEFKQDRIIHLLRNLRRLLGLELRQPFIEMVNAFICVVTDFAWRILIRWLITIN